MAHAIRPVPTSFVSIDGILNDNLNQNIEIEEKLSRVAKHYLPRAMEKAGGNKSKAAKLLGLNSAQTLTNWLKKYGVE